MSRFYSTIWGPFRGEVVNPFLRYNEILFVGSSTIGGFPGSGWILHNFNPTQLYISGATVQDTFYTAQQLQERIWSGLAQRVKEATGGQRLDIEYDYPGILIFDFEAFRPCAAAEKRLGNATLTYDRYTFTDEEYNNHSRIFWTEAFHRYRAGFPNAGVAFYQAPMNFTWSGDKGWYNNQCVTPGCTAAGKGPQLDDLWGSDAELDWFYRELDCIAAHSYMVRVVGQNNQATFANVAAYHRDIAIRAIRLARRYGKPCIVYNERLNVGDTLILTREDYRAWFDGYVQALELTDGGWPMMGAAFWRAASDAGQVITLNNFLRTVFAPAAAEYFPMGSKAGILRGVQ